MPVASLSICALYIEVTRYVYYTYMFPVITVPYSLMDNLNGYCKIFTRI